MLLLLLAMGCAEPITPIDWCEGSIAYDYAPDPESSFTTFPDDHWTVADPSTPTGLRISLHLDENPVLQADFAENYLDWYEQLSTLDGWGVSAELYFQFKSALSLDDIGPDDVLLMALPEGAAPRRIPASWRLVDRDRTLMIQPLVPLPPATQVAVILRTDPGREGCVSPSKHLRALLSPETELGPDEAAHPLSARFIAGVEAAGLELEEVGAMTVFTTQSSTLTSVNVARDIEARGAAFTEPFDCEDHGIYLDCLGALEVRDYRGADGVVPDLEGAPQGSYTLPVRIWMPPEGGPFPAVMCGHGLGGSTNDCTSFAERFPSEGAAMFAIDAVEHGDHPSQTDPPLEVLDPLMIFALSFDPVPTVHGLRLRDNFRQSAWDKLQVLAALEAGVDVDGDGDVDIDAEHLAYAGVSLGAIMAAEPMALSDSLDGAWIANGGARVTQIIQDSDSFGVIIDIMAADIDEGDIERGFALLQTLVDAGDPVAFSPYVTQDRLLDDGHEPSVVGAFSLGDEVVPNTTHDNYMRALGLPGVGREIWAVEGIGFTEGSLSGNLPQGGAGGVVEFDLVTRNGREEDAEHANLHRSDEGLESMMGLLRPVLLQEGEPTVVDPYAD
ncbi:MAG: hypothetical protein H6741_00335 [Alphaproteobacteria bacterium]|nr:hypothetical protein [Alphaproteobacteria bacterium]MCB9791151.1 hypothetical protein [Alphaproteobacteria bacterium]